MFIPCSCFLISLSVPVVIMGWSRNKWNSRRQRPCLGCFQDWSKLHIILNDWHPNFKVFQSLHPNPQPNQDIQAFISCTGCLMHLATLISVCLLCSPSPTVTLLSGLITQNNCHLYLLRLAPNLLTHAWFCSFFCFSRVLTVLPRMLTKTIPDENRN